MFDDQSPAYPDFADRAEVDTWLFERVRASPDAPATLSELVRRLADAGCGAGCQSGGPPLGFCRRH